MKKLSFILLLFSVVSCQNKNLFEGEIPEMSFSEDEIKDIEQTYAKLMGTISPNIRAHIVGEEELTSDPSIDDKFAFIYDALNASGGEIDLGNGEIIRLPEPVNTVEFVEATPVPEEDLTEEELRILMEYRKNNK